MPVFDYRCKDCNKTYDVYHKGQEIKSDVVCPSCGSKSHIRLISAPSISMGGKETIPSGGGGGCASGLCGLN